MSGRIRSIKPELLEDAVTAGLSDRAFRLFIGCILLADDHGGLRLEPAWLRGQVFWANDVPIADFTEALAEVTASLVRPYEVNGQRYGDIRNWKKHQKVDHPSKPRVPRPPDEATTSSRESREDLAKHSATLAPDLRSPIPIPTTDPDPREHETPPASQEHTPFAFGSASCVEACEHFQTAVATATGKPYAMPRAAHERQALVDLLNAHGPRAGLLDGLAWLRTTVPRWVQNVDPQFSGGWAPTKLRNWLNAGAPDRGSGAFVAPGQSARSRRDLTGFKA